MAVAQALAERAASRGGSRHGRRQIAGLSRARRCSGRRSKKRKRSSPLTRSICRSSSSTRTSRSCRRCCRWKLRRDALEGPAELRLPHPPRARARQHRRAFHHRRAGRAGAHRAMGADDQDGTLTDFAVEPDPHVWAQVCSEQHICTPQTCGENPRCFYQDARKRLLTADVVVMNHTLFFLNLGGIAEQEERGRAATLRERLRDLRRGAHRRAGRRAAHRPRRFAVRTAPRAAPALQSQDQEGPLPGPAPARWRARRLRAARSRPRSFSTSVGKRVGFQEGPRVSACASRTSSTTH